tara:strand:- start:480 stop:722 length:243 start_codon:yes stop_codon:yes gene_type:complete
MDLLVWLFWLPISIIAFTLAVIFWATVSYLAFTVVTESWDDFTYWLKTRKEPDLTIDDYVNAGIGGNKSKVKNGKSNRRG